MSEGRHREVPARNVRLAQARRDVALARLSLLTRWSVIGAAALTGLFATAAARAFPGSSKPATALRGAATMPQSSASADDSSSSLQPPSQAPAAATAPSVVSGGS
jgi:hypothetical protein